jgi:hypothetical protein
VCDRTTCDEGDKCRKVVTVVVTENSCSELRERNCELWTVEYRFGRGL